MARALCPLSKACMFACLVAAAAHGPQHIKDTHRDLPESSSSSELDLTALEADLALLTADPAHQTTDGQHGRNKSTPGLEEDSRCPDSRQACCDSFFGPDYAGRVQSKLCFPSTLIYLPSPTDYLFRESWVGMPPASTTACRAAWQDLRGSNPCIALAQTEEPAHLTLTDEARANWELAKRGNVLNGVVDCVSFKVHVLPQPPRTAYGQTDWTLADRARVQGVSQKELTDCYKAKNCNHGHVVSAYIELHGTDTQKQATAAMNVAVTKKPFTADEFCTFESTTKSNFLGFTVWTDAGGTAQFMWNSKQLNGPNLDEPMLPNTDPGTIVMGEKGGGYTGTDGQTHKIGVMTDWTTFTNSIRVLFPNKPVINVRPTEPVDSDVHADALLGEPPFDRL